jgi:glycosyltransferase involved in cell wall biosynthesis
MNGPLVTVVIPVHNGESFLGQAIESALRQDYQPVEVLVLDDGSDDGSRPIAASYGDVRCISQQQAGAAAARNAGLRMARGSFVAFLDHDDVMVPSRLSRQVGFLLGHPDVDCTLGRMEFFLEPGSSWPQWLQGDLRDHRRPWIHPTSLVGSRDTLVGLGGFDIEFQFSEEHDLLFRMRESGLRIEILDEVVIRRRIHDSNLTHTLGDGRWMLNSLKSHLDRARALRAAQRKP